MQNSTKALEDYSLKEAIFGFQELFFGFAPATIIATAAQLGLFSRLKETASANQIAHKLNLSLRGTQRLLNALKALRVLEEREGGFCISQEYVPLFDPDSPLYLGDIFSHALRLQNNWMGLPEVVKTGSPLHRKKDPSFFATLARGLFSTNWFVAVELAEKFTPKPGKVLDVAGGSGVWSTALLLKHPQLTATVLDLPPVIQGAALPIAQRLNLTERYSFIEGDLFNTQWGEGYSTVILGHICHSLGEEGVSRWSRTRWRRSRTEGRRG